MRKLIILILIAAAGYGLYQIEAVRLVAQPVVYQVFNYTPHSLKRFIFPVEIPVDYQGLYMADPQANAQWSRTQNYASQPQPTGRKQIDIREKEMVSQVHARTEREDVEVTKRGDGFIVVYYPGRESESLIALDGNGIWISFEGIAPGYRERYRKVR